MKYFRLTFFLLVAVLTTGFSQNSNGKVTGRVLENQSNPLPYAVIKLFVVSDSNMIQGTIAGDQGLFELSQVADNTYYIEVSNLGYEPARSEVFEVKNGATVQLPDMVLSLQDQLLETVVITSQRPLLEVKTDMTVVNVNENMTSAGEDAMDLLQMVPGVLTINDRIKMNGKSNVKIMINGKVTKMDAQSLAIFLRSISGTSILKIEMITNPSARYDADGNSGILNIVLKKSGALGTKASILTKYSRGINYIFNPSFDITHRAEKMTLYGALAYHDGKYQEDTDMKRLVTTSDGVKNFDQSNKNVTDWGSPSFRAGADFFLNPKNTIGLLAYGSLSDYVQNNLTQTSISNQENFIDSSLIATNRGPTDKLWADFNFYYNYKDTLGTEFKFDTDYYGYIMNGINTVMNDLFDSQGAKYNTIGNIYDTETTIDIFSVKADYIKAFNDDSKFEAGLKVALVNADNDLMADILQDGVQETDFGQSNRFIYNEDVYAGYLNYSTKFNKVGIQVGVRSEFTDVKGSSTDLLGNQINNPDTSYLNFFPSAFLTYDLAPKHMLKAFYSRRINRPNYQDMNPFEYRLDQYTSEVGNPFLRPQYTDNFEFGYVYQSAASLTFSYTNTQDFFAPITTQEGQRTFLTTENIEQMEDYSIKLNLPLPISQAIYGFAWVGVYKSVFQGELDGFPLDAGQWSLNAYAETSFKFKGNLRFKLSGWYNAPKRSVIFEESSTGSVSTSVSKSFFEKRLYVSLTYSDIFNTQRWKSEVNFGDMRINLHRTWESNRVGINVRYVFGNTKLKKQAKRNAANDAEQNRVKS